jgi:hypothetical protein
VLWKKDLVFTFDPTPLNLDAWRKALIAYFEEPFQKQFPFDFETDDPTGLSFLVPPFPLSKFALQTAEVFSSTLRI